MSYFGNNEEGTEEQYYGCFDNNISYLLADTNAAEATHSTAVVDFLSNGFKWRGAVNFGNNSSRTYAYAAFAEAPFKYANAG